MKIRAHESFYLRKGWLYKGIKNIKINDRLFNDKDANACDVLGIGANMVKSLKYWLLATGVAEEKNNEDNKKIIVPSELGEIIDKYDRYYEEVGTNLIIQYKLASNIEDATAWYWLFNEYEATIIDKDIFEVELNQYIKYQLEKEESKVLGDEFNCIIKTYIQSEKDNDPEETKICPLSELRLLLVENSKTKEYRKNSPSIDDIHPMIAYAIICDSLEGRDEIKISDICNQKCGLGKVYNLSRTSIILLLDKLAKMGYIRLNRTAGLDTINILKPMKSIEAIESYYEDLNGEI